jgi:hypothetical protein
MPSCKNCDVDLGPMLGHYCPPCNKTISFGFEDDEGGEDDIPDEDDTQCGQCDSCGVAFVISEGHVCNF